MRRSPHYLIRSAQALALGLVSSACTPTLDTVRPIEPSAQQRSYKSSFSDAIDPVRQATLIFTATGLGKNYRGENLGIGSLRLYEPGGQCEKPPKTLTQTQEVTADDPVTLLTVPAGRPLVLASFWTSGAAHCVVGNYAFSPQENSVYRLTNTQNRRDGVCSLRLQRQVANNSRYVEDYSLRPARRLGCSRSTALK